MDGFLSRGIPGEANEVAVCQGVYPESPHADMGCLLRVDRFLPRDIPGESTCLLRVGHRCQSALICQVVILAHKSKFHPNQNGG